MKKLPLILSVLALTISLGSIYTSKNTELVYVDVNKLIEGYQRTKIAKAEFDKKANIARANLDSLEKGWQNEMLSYEKERLSMSPKELKLKQELMSTKQQQINNYQQGIQKQIQDEDKKITQTIINDINDYVKEYGKKKGYKIVFGASGGGNIMYADEAADITENILKGLNAEYDKK